MTQDARRQWLPAVVAHAALVPAGFVSALLLFGTCFDAATGTAGPGARAAACNAWDGNAVLVCLVAVVVLGLGAVVLSVRRGARGPGVWLLAALPALGVVLVPVLIGLLPLR